MNPFRHIFTALYKSVYDPVWIAGQRTKLGRAVLYFFVFFFVVLLCVGTYLARTLPGHVQGVRDELLTNLPDNVAVALTDGTLEINGIEQPYRSVFQDEDSADDVLIYIDTMTTSSVSVDDAFGERSQDIAGVIITSKKIKIYDAGLGEVVRTEDVSNLPNFTMSKDELNQQLDTIMKRFLPSIVVLGSLVLTGIWGGFKMLFLCFIVWLAYVVVRADKKPWTYKQLFTVGLYVLTVPTIVQALMVVFLGAPIPYVYFILTLVYLFWVIYKGKVTTLVAPAPTPVGDVPSVPPVVPPSPPIPPTPPVPPQKKKKKKKANKKK